MTKRRKAPEITDEEEALITAAALSDPDSPPLTDEQLATMRPVSEGRPHLIERHHPERRVRGPQKAPTKRSVTIRLSESVLEHFKAGGRGWQTRIDDVLVEHVEKAQRKRRPNPNDLIAKVATAKSGEFVSHGNDAFPSKGRTVVIDGNTGQIQGPAKAKRRRKRDAG